MRSKGGLAAAAIALSWACLGSAPAEGAATRAEYVAQAEPICIAAEQQAQRGLKRFVRKLKQQSRRLKKKLQGLGNPGTTEAPELTKGQERKLRRKLLQFLAVFFAKLAAPANIAFDQATAQLRSIVPAPGDESAIATWLAARSEFARLNYLAVAAGRHGKFKRFLVFTAKADDVLRQGQGPVAAFGFDHCFVENPEAVIGPPQFSGLRTPR